jgi:hypothetical protein
MEALLCVEARGAPAAWLTRKGDFDVYRRWVE